MNRENGFTLVELLITMAVIGILTSIVIPSLLRSRMSANEASTVASLKTIAGAEIDFFNNTTPHTFTESLEFLGNGTNAGGVGFIDESLSCGVKAGYTFAIQSGKEASIIGSGGKKQDVYYAWSAAARPISYMVTGVRSFYVDDSGVVRGSDIGGVIGSVVMPPYDR